MNSKKLSTNYFLSIIIPCFNSGKTIDKTLNSIINQDKSDLIEIIVVDDGSTDETLHVLSKYKEIKVISKRVNAGVSSARNSGLSIASGEYILFLDSDDIFLDGLINKIETISKNGDYDLIIFSYQKYNLNKNKLSPVNLELNGHFKSTEILKLFLSKKIKPHLCTFCISNKIAVKLKFDEHITHGEDLLYQLQVLVNATTVMALDYIFFEYTISGFSAMNKPYTNKRFNGFESIKVYLSKVKRGYYLNEDVKKYIDQYIISSYITFLVKVFLHKTNDPKLITTLIANKNLLDNDIYDRNIFKFFSRKFILHFFWLYILIIKARSNIR
ncbi:glycosyltransferase [Shewanella putrefaciens]|uniref:glycosyltransferase family 2 protein n=1 Tax=Shewanella putrefaciens TaxID=24 RepID=UPI0021BE71E6|nr:glycosyltransferase family 2 protein [Shewanella putrefaciens]UXK09896.1 glycosyltransferase [Shewanella putrefaciens]